MSFGVTNNAISATSNIWASVKLPEAILRGANLQNKIFSEAEVGLKKKSCLR